MALKKKLPDVQVTGRAFDASQTFQGGVSLVQILCLPLNVSHLYSVLLEGYCPILSLKLGAHGLCPEDIRLGFHRLKCNAYVTFRSQAFIITTLALDLEYLDPNLPTIDWIVTPAFVCYVRYVKALK